MRCASLLVMVCVVGCGGGTGGGAAGVVPSTPEEKVVAEFLLKNSDNPESIRFEKWGPNWVPFGIPTSDKRFHGMVRVCYRARVGGDDRYFDRVFPILVGGAVFGNAEALRGKEFDNAFGDNWIQSLKASIRQ